jgi:hypothetical protein
VTTKNSSDKRRRERKGKESDTVSVGRAQAQEKGEVANNAKEEERQRAEVTMRVHPVTKLRDSRWEFQDEGEQAEEKATMGEKEEEANEKERMEVTG